MNLKRLKDESLTGYHIRLFENQELLEISSQDIADLLNKESGYSYSESKWRKDYAQYVRWKQYLEDTGFNENTEIEKLTVKKLELQKERNKLSAEKLEINKWIREQARTENIYDKIEQAINNLKPIDVPDIKIQLVNTEKELIIDIADAHIGKKTELRGFNNEILSEYNTEIFKKYMWKLLKESLEIIEKEHITHVTVLNLGDLCDGLLHTNQLKHQELGVMEQVMFAAEFMSEWLNELSRYVTIDYRSVSGNHGETRALNSGRSEFREENVEVLVEWYIRKRLENNKRVKVHEINHIIYFDVLGTKILSVHGQDEKNLERSVREYMSIYDVKVNILKTGHLHHFSGKTISIDGASGQNIELVQSPAISGFDAYALNIKKTSVAGTLITLIKKDYGKYATYDIRF